MIPAPERARRSSTCGRTTAAVRRQRLSTSRWCAEGPVTCRVRRTDGSPIKRRLVQVILGVSVAGGAILKLAATATAAGMIWIHLCGSYTPGSGSTWGTLCVAHSGTSNAGVTTPFGCPPRSSGSNPYGMEVFGGGSGVPAGKRAYWQIDAPAGLVIVGVHTRGSGMVSYGVN